MSPPSRGLTGAVPHFSGPVVGGRYLPYVPEMLPDLMLQVAAALCARERFPRDAPAWAPALPLHEDAIETFKNADDTRLNLLGYYGGSLAWAEWDYDAHPRFDVFASGLLAYKYTPEELRNDRTLLREFPPRPLPGLCDEWMVWRSADQIKTYRQQSAWVNEMNARREEGTAKMQAINEWVATQLPMFCGCC